MINENSFKLYSPKGLWNFDKVFEYHWYFENITCSDFPMLTRSALVVSVKDQNSAQILRSKFATKRLDIHYDYNSAMHSNMFRMKDFCRLVLNPHPHVTRSVLSFKRFILKWLWFIQIYKKHKLVHHTRVKRWYEKQIVTTHVLRLTASLIREKRHALNESSNLFS